SFCDYTEYFAFDGTLAGSSGTAPAGVTDPVAYDPGKYGKCAQLGHSGQLPTSLPHAEPLREDQGTVSMWFKPETAGAGGAPHTLFGTKGAGPTSLCVQGQGILSNAPPGAAAIPSSPTFVDSNWNHLVVTYSVVSLPLQELLNGRLTVGEGAYSPKGSFG